MGRVLSFQGDRHTPLYKVMRSEEETEFRRIPPTRMVDITLIRMRANRKEDAAHLESMQEPHTSADGKYKTMMAPFIIRAMKANLDRLDATIALLVAARESMSADSVLEGEQDGGIR